MLFGHSARRGGKYKAFVIAATTGNWGNDFQINLGNGGIVSTMVAGPGNRKYLSRNGTTHPLIFSIFPGNQGPLVIDEELYLTALRNIYDSVAFSGPAAFLKGFAAGLYEGGYH